MRNERDFFEYIDKLEKRIEILETAGTFPKIGWADLIGDITARATGLGNPTYVVYNGGIYAYKFAVGDSIQLVFHMPHDYLIGSDMFIHTHWSTNSSGTPSGSVTWQFETSYSKGHQQAAFSATKTTTVSKTIEAQYRHMVTETQLSITGGSASLLDSDSIEPDGLLLIKASLTANTSSPAMNIFAHTIDIHYQSNGEVGTKNKAPNFYA